MTTSTAHQAEFDFWGSSFPAPQPTQDADLLHQLEFIPGLKELLMLRQVHALEHATVWVLSGAPVMGQRRDWSFAAADNERLGGLSTDQGFYLYGQVNTADLKRAVQRALQRLTRGEWNLAVHPRCGTNVSVGMLLTAGLAIGFHVLLPKGPIEQLVALGVAATTAAQLAPDIGSMAQRYITTSIPFNLAIEEISATQDYLGRPAHFIRVRWVE